MIKYGFIIAYHNAGVMHCYIFFSTQYSKRIKLSSLLFGINNKWHDPN